MPQVWVNLYHCIEERIWSGVRLLWCAPTWASWPSLWSLRHEHVVLRLHELRAQMADCLIGTSPRGGQMQLSELIGRLGCHQIPERCLVVFGKRMPFCSRCFGAAVGHCASMVLLVAGRPPSYWLCLLFVGVLAVDWSLQQWFGIVSTNGRRLCTGILGGLGVGTIWWRALWHIVNCLPGALTGLR